MVNFVFSYSLELFLVNAFSGNAINVENARNSTLSVYSIYSFSAYEFMYCICLNFRFWSTIKIIANIYMSYTTSQILVQVVYT